MENQVRKRNKIMVKGLVEQLPHKSDYAERIVRHLARKGITVSKAQVYQAATAKTYNALIIWKLAVLVRFHRIQDAKLHRTLTQLTDA